jgi:hypothetical protein
MKRLLGKLTYANVMVTILAFAVLGGGTAFAAKEALLPKSSVGTKQLKKEAVTPAKLSTASKAALMGPTGATGATGAPGPQGLKGEKGDRGGEGEQGPGAISFEIAVPENGLQNVIRSYEGMNIVAKCSASGSLEAGVATSGETASLNASGRYTTVGNSNVSGSVSKTGAASIVKVESGAEAAVIFDIIARNTQVGAIYTHFDLHAGDKPCALWGVITPSSAG